MVALSATEVNGMTQATAHPGADSLEIERMPDGVVRIRAIYPAEAQRRDKVVLWVVCGTLTVTGAVASWLLHRYVGWIAATAAAGFVVMLMVSLITGAARWARSCEITATPDVMTVNITSGRSAGSASFRRNQIADIRLGFGQRYGLQIFPKYGAWLIIDAQPPIECLHRFGGDQLARVADELRHTLGMPKRSWP
jgi:hypothetical protein